MSNRKSFKQSVKEALGSYVYALVDPRDDKIFYIGKGKGDRVFDHIAAAISDPDDTKKLSTIREIIAEGSEVRHYIIRHNLTEHEANIVESTLIDLLTYPDFNTERVLTNIASGHHQWDEGIKTEEEVIQLYDCQKIEPNPQDRMLLVSLNQSYIISKSAGLYRRANDYESARKYWKISNAKVHKIDYILGIYRGIVRIIIKVNNFRKTNVADDGTVFPAPRYIFEGDVIEDSPYLNKSVMEYPFGRGGAVTYIPNDPRLW